MHVDQSEYHFGTSLIHFRVVIFGTYFFDLTFGNSLIHFGTSYVLFRGRYIRYRPIPRSLYSVLSHLASPTSSYMADRTRDGGVEERTEGQRLLLYKGVLVRALNLHRDQKSLARTGER